MLKADAVSRFTSTVYPQTVVDAEMPNLAGERVELDADSLAIKRFFVKQLRVPAEFDATQEGRA